MHTPSRTRTDRALRRALADIQSDDAVTRFEAAKTLSSGPSAFVALRTLLRSTAQTPRRLPIVYALAWLNDLRGWALFIRILRDQNESPEIRSQAAEGLAYLFPCKRRGSAGIRSAIESLTAALTDSSADVRYYAAFALGASGERTTIPALRHATQDSATSTNFVGMVGDEARDAIERIESAASTRPAASRRPIQPKADEYEECQREE